ncbi:MAG TPA: adenosylcobinamide-GDP ribazoletransferase [Streptosporangiaceae bacterium]|jgi:adenosylcobinamide-GDP ribazoletransferase
MSHQAGQRGIVSDLLASIGVLTAIPVARQPRRRAATLGLAPVAGVLLGLLAGGAAAGGHWLFPDSAGALLAAALTIGGLALLTRGLHLDGLADTADGLGPLGGPAAGLAAMRRPDIGPFGVVALVLILVIQCAALARDITLGRGFASVLVAVVAGRLAMTWAGVPGVPAARPDGLGAWVAGSVPRPAALAWTGLAVAGTLAPAAFGAGWTALRLTAALAAALAAGVALRRHAVRRLGGITGDVLGAICELAVLAALLVTAIR